MRNYRGHAIIDGQLKYASVSSVKLFDKRTRGGCPRRWWKRYVGGEREPETDNMIEAKAAGISLDKEMKNYLLTGDKAMSALAIKGLHIMEAPGPNLAVDVQIDTVEHYVMGSRVATLPEGQKYPPGHTVVIKSELTAGGIPFVGELDIVQSRGHYRDDEGEYHQDPPGTVEVADLKYKSNAKDRNGNSNFMLATDLVRDIQMAGYGEWVGRVRPSTQHVRLSHLYFPKNPRGALPTKVTRLHVLDDCRRTWEYVDSVVRYMVDVAKETDLERVPGADRSMSCDAYSGCPYRETCSVYKQTSLDNIYGKIANDHLQEKQTMGIIAQTQPQLMQQAAVPSQQQLAQEEATMRAQVAQQQQQMPQQQFNPGEFLAICTRLGGYGFGMPSLAGNAAQAYAAAGGQSVAPGFVYQGMMAQPGAPYSLHNITLTEVQQIYQLERECAAKVGPAPTPQYAPVQMPASTPPVTQAIANVYNQAIAQQPVQMQNAVPSFLPPGAPESRPELAQARPVDTAPTLETPAAPAKKPGRPKKSDSGPAPEQTAATAPAPSLSSVVASQVTPAAAPTSQPGSQAAAPTSTPAPAPTGLDSAAVRCAILVNARFSNVATKSLAGYVDYVNAELSKRYSVTADGKPGIQDVRCAPKDSVLSFGGWKGAVREVVKADPPSEGAYHLDTFMDELNEAVADALRAVAESKGWMYVRGVR